MAKLKEGSTVDNKPIATTDIATPTSDGLLSSTDKIKIDGQTPINTLPKPQYEALSPEAKTGIWFVTEG